MTTVHLLGCLGNGMAALARLYRGMGIDVTGCDARVGELNTGPTIDRLKRLGVPVVDSATCRLGVNSDTVVHTLAASADHPELALGIPARTRVQALAELLPRIADTVVAVSGVTGKTTIAGLIGQIYRELGARPAVYIGGDVDELTDGPHETDSDRLAVVEACEVRGGMMSIPATVAVVTMVYWGEHPASYPTLDSLENAFGRFVDAAPSAVLPEEYRHLCRAGDVVTFGTRPGADVRLCEWYPESAGFTARYDVLGTTLDVTARLHGTHNALNLAAALAAHVAAGTPIETLTAVDFSRLRAPRRRIERLGRHDTTTVYDDFGHNPVQIAAAHEVLRYRHPDGPLGASFQPAGFERLHAFGMRYADALQQFDRVRVSPARRTFEDTASTADESDFSTRLVAELRRRGVDADVRPADFADCTAACFFGILAPIHSSDRV